MNKKPVFGILKNESEDIYRYWESSCNKYGYDYHIFDILNENWLQEILSSKIEHFLLCPPGLQSHFKTMYDERIYILSQVLKLFTHPAYNELIIHENKKLLAYFLQSQGIPHPSTKVFYRKEDALAYVLSSKLPLVGKMNIGASGSGVRILHSSEKAEHYVRDAFSKGIRSSFGPNLKTGNYWKRAGYALSHPVYLLERLKKYKSVAEDYQKHFVLIQEYIPHEYEWRVVKIGDSFFGHKKTKFKEKASGSKGIDYVTPPIKLLEFARVLCEQQKFTSMAIDCFEDESGSYLVNELQTVFGHVQDHICELNGKPGRWRYKNENWIFESGEFNSNLSYDLRMENVLNLLGQYSE